MSDQRGADGAGMTAEQMQAIRRETMPPFGAMTLEHLRLYGSGWCTEVTFALMCDVIDAAERRRQAEIRLIESRGTEAMHFYAERSQQALRDVDAALVALTAHLTTTSGEEMT
jgi:hypothetical protein